MLNFKTLRCSNCDSVLVNIPESELNKLNGRTFYCECCGQPNVLNDSVLYKKLKIFVPLAYLCLETLQGF